MPKTALKPLRDMKRQGRIPMQVSEVTCPALGFCTFSLQNWEAVNCYWLSHPVCGTSRMWEGDAGYFQWDNLRALFLTYNEQNDETETSFAGQVDWKQNTLRHKQFITRNKPVPSCMCETSYFHTLMHTQIIWGSCKMWLLIQWIWSGA